MSTKQETRSEKKRQTSQQTKSDIAFQERLDEHSKRALIYLVDQLTCQDRVNRGWMLQYLADIDTMIPAPRANSLQDSVLEAIKNERLAQDCRIGPVRMRPMTINEWTHELSLLMSKANTKAAYGQKHAALKAILMVATQSVAALEDRIDAEAERGKDLLAEAIKAVTSRAKGSGETADGPGKAGIKTAGTADTAPAGEYESLENQ